MKKYFIIAAAIATMVSCQKNASLEVAPVAEDNAITFSVYNSTPATKGTLNDSARFFKQGVGIFAFYQPAGSGFFNTKKYATPDFMYNQQLVRTGSTGNYKWEYSPVKYWPNNVGDRLSFFAYAPYETNVVWDDMNVLTDATSTKLTASFSIADDVDHQKDYLWADPLINQTNKDPFKDGAIVDTNANKTSTNLHFVFKHVTSKVDIHLGVAQQYKSTTPAVTAAGAWTDSSTVIYIENIIFKGLKDGFDYVYKIDASGNMTFDDTYSSTYNTYDMVVAPRPGVDTVTVHNWKQATDSIGINSANNGVLYKSGDNQNYAKYLGLSFLAGKDSTLTGADGLNGQFMFLAPQKFTNETVTISYKVVTKDKKTLDGSNDSTIKNQISKSLAEIFPGDGLKAGSAYNMKFLIGMDDVNITAALTDWDPTTVQNIYVPINK